jgi:Kef-type K+ transport system membrane component KefB
VRDGERLASIGCLAWPGFTRLDHLDPDSFLAGFGAILLTFLAGTEIDALYNRLIGSTTDRLVELAPCKVLVVK